jgi:hypothetical protein
MFAAAGTEQEDVHEMQPDGMFETQSVARISLWLQGGEQTNQRHSGRRALRDDPESRAVWHLRTTDRDSGFARIASAPE